MAIVKALIDSAGQTVEIQSGDSITDHLTQSGAKVSATATGTNTYTATITPAITSYPATGVFYIKFTNANTGAATLNLNGLGAKNLLKDVLTPLTDGDIKAGQIVSVFYDGTNFQVTGTATGVISGPFIMNGVVTPATLTGDVDDYSPPNMKDNSILRINATGNINITGLDSTGIVNGQVITIVNISNKTYELVDGSGSSDSLAQNRFLVNGGLNVQSNESVSVWYDTANSRWRAWAANI